MLRLTDHPPARSVDQLIALNKSSGRDMESLPGDLLLVVIRKLAAQDPLSLLKATYALASVYRAAAEKPDIRVEAIYGPPFAHASSDSQMQDCVEEREELEAEIDKLGGFKRFVFAQFVSERFRRSGAEDTSLRTREVSPEVYDMQSNPFYCTNFLTLIRLHGTLLFWSTDSVLVVPRDVQITPEHRERWATVSLTPFPPAEFLEDSLRAWKTRDGDNDSRCNLIELLKALSVEVYVYRREGSPRAGASAEYPNILFGGFDSLKQGKLEEMGTDSVAWRNFCFRGFSSTAVQAGSSTMGNDSYLRVDFGTPPRWTFHWDEVKESALKIKLA